MKTDGNGLGIRKARRGITLIEFIVSVGIAAILMAIAVPFYMRVRQQTKAVTCLNNLKGISAGLNGYLDREGSFPLLGASLADSLKGYVDNPEAFKCPVDEPEAGDSYSLFYAARERHEDREAFVVGCPRHDSFRRALTVHLDLNAQSSYGARVEVVAPGGTQTLVPGDSATNGAIWMSDQSNIRFSGGQPKVYLLVSFLFQEKPYHLFRLSRQQYGELQLFVATGSRLDVLTASANLTARNSQFSVETGLTLIEGERRHWTLVRVLTGQIKVVPIIKGRMSEVNAGAKRTVVGPVWQSSGE